MGQLLTTLNFKSNSDSIPEINFDIENAKPSIDELEVYTKLNKILVLKNKELLRLFKEYKEGTEYIRIAIASPTKENEDNAWNNLLPTVEILKEFYNYSIELEKGIPILLELVCKDTSTTKQLDKHPGITKLFADILEFVFEFDYMKVQFPTLQNDFSFYRRTLQRGKLNNKFENDLNENDLANRISLFIAYPTPLLKSIIDTTTEFTKLNKLEKSTSEWLFSLWAVCYQIVYKKKNSTIKKDSFFLKVMVLSIILFDHIDPLGAFIKSSPIQVKNSIKLIQNFQPQTSTCNLLSTLKYNSKHLNDDSTPKIIKNLILSI